MVERLFIGYMPKITPVAGNYSDTFRKYSYSLLKKRQKRDISPKTRHWSNVINMLTNILIALLLYKY